MQNKMSSIIAIKQIMQVKNKMLLNTNHTIIKIQIKASHKIKYC